jgi:hypothetical protein
VPSGESEGPGNKQEKLALMTAPSPISHSHQKSWMTVTGVRPRFFFHKPRQGRNRDQRQGRVKRDRR